MTLTEGVSVRRSVSPSVGPSVRGSVRSAFVSTGRDKPANDLFLVYKLVFLVHPSNDGPVNGKSVLKSTH